MPIKSISTLSRLAAATVLTFALHGCAGKQERMAKQVEHGPTFLVEGRISVNRVARPVIIANFTWARGNRAAGWTERITLEDPTGTRVFRVTSTPAGTIAKTPRRTFREASLQDLLHRQLGMDLDPRRLAGWLANEHGDGELPDEVKFDNTHVQVIERGGDGRPIRLRVLHDGNILLLVVKSYQDS